MVTSICAKRAVFTIDGVCDCDTKQFVLVDEKNGQTYEPTYCENKDGQYKLLLNIESINNQMPLLTGEYHLARIEAGEMKKESCDVTIDESRISIIKSDKEYITCEPEKDDHNNLYFSVRTKLPEANSRSLKKRIAEFGFNAVYKTIEFVMPKTGKKIFITSGSRAEIGGNEEFIYREMLKRGWDHKYHIIMDFKPGISIRYKPVKMLKFIYNMATADVIIVDDYYPEINKVKYSKKTSIFQVWHACGAFKTVGLERTDKKGAPPINSMVHKCYTHVPVSSQLSAFHQQEAYGIDMDKFYTVGIPRTDVFFDDRYKQDICETIYSEYPQLKAASRVILYAPTFRGESALDAYFPQDAIDLNRLGELCRRTGSYLVIKMHPFVKDKVEIPQEYKECILDASSIREVNDLLFVTDILITDYSSVIYEFALLKRPMLFYAFDEDEYIKDRDFYESYEETVPGRICHTFDELIEGIKMCQTEPEQEIEIIDKFIKKNFTYTDGRATERVVDLIESCLKRE